MARITGRGVALAHKVERITGEAPALSDQWKVGEACSLIARHATTLHKLYEAACNGHPAMSDPNVPIEKANRLQAGFETWLAKRQDQLERRILELAKDLPGVAGVRFEADPRGAPVRLVTENGAGDSWAGGEIIVER